MRYTAHARKVVDCQQSLSCDIVSVRHKTKPREEIVGYTLPLRKQILQHPWKTDHHTEDTRHYGAPLVEIFRRACMEYSSVSVNEKIMAGAPCFSGTRIPVYMVLDTISYKGTLESALEYYPRLNLEQVKDAIGFARFVLECPLDQEEISAPT